MSGVCLALVGLTDDAAVSADPPAVEWALDAIALHRSVGQIGAEMGDNRRQLRAPAPRHRETPPIGFPRTARTSDDRENRPTDRRRTSIRDTAADRWPRVPTRRWDRDPFLGQVGPVVPLAAPGRPRPSFSRSSGQEEVVGGENLCLATGNQRLGSRAEHLAHFGRALGARSVALPPSGSVVARGSDRLARDAQQASCWFRPRAGRYQGVSRSQTSAAL